MITLSRLPALSLSEFRFAEAENALVHALLNCVCPFSMFVCVVVTSHSSLLSVHEPEKKQQGDKTI